MMKSLFISNILILLGLFRLSFGLDTDKDYQYSTVDSKYKHDDKVLIGLTRDPHGENTPHPSTFPTISPSSLPTIISTFNPSATPTVRPTRVPTSTRSVHPTADPTIQPTSPTVVPTLRPTRPPTITPTFRPSTLPTLNPTACPTYSPPVLSSDVDKLGSASIDVAISPIDGTIYYSTPSGSCGSGSSSSIYSINPDTFVSSIYIGCNVAPGFSSITPTYLAFNSSGDLFYANSSNINYVDKEKYSHFYASTGNNQYTVLSVSFTDNKGSVVGLAFDSSNNLYYLYFDSRYLADHTTLVLVTGPQTAKTIQIEFYALILGLVPSTVMVTGLAYQSNTNQMIFASSYETKQGSNIKNYGFIQYVDLDHPTSIHNLYQASFYFTGVALDSSNDLYFTSDNSLYYAGNECDNTHPTNYYTLISSLISLDINSTGPLAVNNYGCIYFADTQNVDRLCPTTIPTAIPSMVPSFKPSKVPTLVPTATPSVTSSLNPSYEPTCPPVPTNAPVIKPTHHPTHTKHPTVKPSHFPTHVHAPHPTHNPTYCNCKCYDGPAPTHYPTHTKQPSIQPTHYPTHNK